MIIGEYLIYKCYNRLSKKTEDIEEFLKKHSIKYAIRFQEIREETIIFAPNGESAYSYGEKDFGNLKSKILSQIE